jgi:hypothetical protein
LDTGQTVNGTCPSTTFLVEIKFSWYRDDLPPMMFIKASPNSHRFVNPRDIEELWRDQFDWVYREYDYPTSPSLPFRHPDTPIKASVRTTGGRSADRWTSMMIAAHTQLRLCRPLANDLRRPWEKPLPAHQLSPARVRRGFATSTRRPDLQPLHQNPADLARAARQDPPTHTAPRYARSARPPQPTTPTQSAHDQQVKDQAKDLFMVV